MFTLLCPLPPFTAQRIVVKNCRVSLVLEEMSQELVFDDSHGGASLTTNEMVSLLYCTKQQQLFFIRFSLPYNIALRVFSVR